jgi:hypothetical protein
VFKIKYRWLLFLALLAFVVFLNGCGEEPECKVADDCSQRSCNKVSCRESQCVYDPVPNCCGNQAKDAIENGKPGNKCTCPQDYGACEGKAFKTVSNRKIDYDYIRYFCENSECILGVPSEDIRPVTLLREGSLDLFKFEVTLKYNDPFDTTKDFFDFTFTLKDDTDNLIYPVRLNKIILIDGEVLYGERNLKLLLDGIGDSIVFKVPVSHILKNLEESRGLTYKIDFEYEQRVRSTRLPNGTYSYTKEAVRRTYQDRFATKLNLFMMEKE